MAGLRLSAMQVPLILQPPPQDFAWNHFLGVVVVSVAERLRGPSHVSAQSGQGSAERLVIMLES